MPTRREYGGDVGPRPRPEIASQIDADGDRFMDRAMRFYIVEECR